MAACTVTIVDEDLYFAQGHVSANKIVAMDQSSNRFQLVVVVAIVVGQKLAHVHLEREPKFRRHLDRLILFHCELKKRQGVDGR